jgi:hypothetical protein
MRMNFKPKSQTAALRALYFGQFFAQITSITTTTKG